MDVSSWLPILLHTLAVLLILVGLAGTILPALPGVPLMLAGMILSAWAGDFQQVGWGWIAVLAALTALALLADFVAGLLGAKRVGASVWALVGAGLGTVVGLFFGIPGLLLGPFVGALLGELVAGSNLKRATHVGVGAWIGFVVGTVLKIGIAFMMIGLFAFAWIF